MSPHYHLHLLPLLLTVSTVLPFSNAGTSTSPSNFNPMCADFHDGEFPESQVILANLDYYNMNIATGLILTGWNRSDDGNCDNSIIACSDNPSSTNNVAVLENIDVKYYDTSFDPIYLETNFTCSSCDGCILNVTVETDSGVDSFTYNCNGENEVLQEYEANTRFDLRYSVIFSGSVERECIRINRYRVYYYRDCPATVLNLTNLPSTDSGILNTSGQCVDNSESSNQVAFGCSMSEWVQVSTAMCQCSAGFEPNDDLTACEVCADGHIKPNVSNDQCEVCTGNNQVSNPERTQCICAENFIGVNCDDCEMNYFISGGACVMCPAGSMRDSDTSLHSCSCADNLVTQSGIDTTDGDNCDKCGGGYFRNASGCVRCPEGSNRMFGEDEGYCSCNEGFVTSKGSNITNSTSVGCIVASLLPTTTSYPSTEVHSGNTTVLVSLFPSAPPSMEEPSEDVTLYIYIGMSVAAVVLIVATVIVIPLIVCLKKRQKVDNTDIVNVADNIVSYGTSKDRMELSENIAYGTTTFGGNEDGYEYVSTTVNDIDISTSPNEAYATTDNVPVVNNQAYGMVHH